MFGLGCFWGAERLFWKIPGVWTTAVGYAGGFTPNPTYEETCSGLTGHAEVVLVVFDPAAVSYRDLLQVFFDEHDPTQGMRQGNDVGSQYRSAIYVSSDDQRREVDAAVAAFDAALVAAGRKPVTTEVSPAWGMPLRIASLFIGATAISTLAFTTQALASYAFFAEVEGNRLAPKLMLASKSFTIDWTTW